MTKTTNLPELSKMLPHAESVEVAVLSAIMIEKTALPLIVDELSAEVFYKTAHQEIFAAAVWLFERSHAIDILTLMNRLKATDRLEKVGGPAYLAELSSKVTSAANVEHHSKILIEKYVLREIIYRTRKVSDSAYRGNDAFDLLDELSDLVINVSAKVSGGATAHVGMIAEKMVQSIKESQANGGQMEGVVFTSIDDLDNTLGGMQPGDLHIIAARPAMGKTTFVQQIARKVAITQGVAVSLQSLEMTEFQITGGMVCAESGVNKDRIRDFSKFTEDELKRFELTAADFHNYPIYITDTPATNINQVRASAKAAQHQAKRDGKKLGLVAIDYLQLMTGSGKSNWNREQVVSEISKGLKRLAKELGVPVIALSQLSRAVETRGGDKRPQLSDLRESGSIEQDADGVMFLYRPEYYKITEDAEGNSMKGITEIIVGKNRHGEAKDVRCKLDLETGVFMGIDTDFFNDETAPEKPYTGIITTTTVNTDDEIVPF